PRVDESIRLRPAVARCHKELAHVPAGRPVRPGLRHRQRGWAARGDRRRRDARGARGCGALVAILFAAGMSLLDTADGAFISHAYGWAFANPVRKVYYNITVTSLSVLVALMIGTVELIQVASAALQLTGGAWDWLNALDFELLGYT